MYWTRHFDRYELFRNDPVDWYTGHNYHETEVLGANLNATTQWKLGRTSMGVKFRNRGVKSNVLGKPMKEPQDAPSEKEGQYLKNDNRGSISYFPRHNILLHCFTLPVGILANYNSALSEGIHFCPGVDASYRIGGNFYLYGSWSWTLRMPTFTDLYYEGKMNEENPDLKPEGSETLEVGLKYNTYFLRAHIIGSYRKNKNVINWVKKKPEDIWENQDLTRIDNLGFEISLSLLPRGLDNERFFIRKMEPGYVFIRQDKDSEGYMSSYALDYLKHKFTAQPSHSIWKGFSATWYVRWRDRAGSYTKYENLKPAYEEPYVPYYLVDMKVNWEHQWLDLYAELNSLLSSTCYDLGNIPQLGIWFRAGFRYSFKY